VARPPLRSEPRHVLVSPLDAERLTGQPHEDLLTARDVQTLTRVRPDGRREELLRIPTALLLSEQADANTA
jgi:hypothetical protein